jgi:hypothetical protein
VTTSEHGIGVGREASGPMARKPRIVVGVADSESGLAALAYAVREARARDASVHLVRVWRDVGWLFSATAAGMIGLRERERADGLVLAIAAEAARSAAPSVHVIAEFVPGDLYTELQARTEGAELLVVGWGDDDDPDDHLIAQWFEEHAACPVVVVPSRRPGVADVESPGTAHRAPALAAAGGSIRHLLPG